jgi:hypothetical protein
MASATPASCPVSSACRTDDHKHGPLQPARVYRIRRTSRSAQGERRRCRGRALACQCWQVHVPPKHPALAIGRYTDMPHGNATVTVTLAHACLFAAPNGARSGASNFKIFKRWSAALRRSCWVVPLQSTWGNKEHNTICRIPVGDWCTRLADRRG